jgi:hypothetical protein
VGTRSADAVGTRSADAVDHGGSLVTSAADHVC